MTPATAPAAPTILVIEDYSDTREMLCLMLRKKGYDVIEAEDGLKGLVQARSRFPDLIIMDLALPEMDGIETARRIHETPELTHIPIFAVSGYLTKDVQSDVHLAGCVEMFSKPYDFESLLESISVTLGLR